jgi:hypothetical protein
LGCFQFWFMLLSEHDYVSFSTSFLNLMMLVHQHLFIRKVKWKRYSLRVRVVICNSLNTTDYTYTWMTNENHSPARHSNTSFSLIVRLGIADCRSIQAQRKHRIRFTIHQSPVLLLQSLDLLGQSNNFFSVLRLERRAIFPQ